MSFVSARSSLPSAVAALRVGRANSPAVARIHVALLVRVRVVRRCVVALALRADAVVHLPILTRACWVVRAVRGAHARGDSAVLQWVINNTLAHRLVDLTGLVTRFSPLLAQLYFLS